MASNENAHDKLFKSALGDRDDAAMELRAVLPTALARQIDFATLEPLPGSFIDEHMRGSHADLLYSVQCAGRDTCLYVLFEHKSEVDRWTLLQLLRYMVRIWEQCLAQKSPPPTLPPIIPVIVHHSETGWTAPTHFHALFEEHAMVDAELRRLTPEFEVQLDDISHLSDEELRARGMGPAATLSLLFLRDGRREGRVVAELLAWADLFRNLSASPEGRDALLRLFSYLLMVAPNLGLEDLAQQVQRAMPERNDVVSTLAEKLIEEGEKRGLEKGRQEGLQTGLQTGRKEAVRRLIELKFGAIGAQAIARIEAADEAQLARFMERLLTAASVDVVLGE
jgi:predicted transposase/invertase (TIGR01784 family)